jgi:glycosyltransferase involved in cell wall biosynthesis
VVVNTFYGLQGEPQTWTIKDLEKEKTVGLVPILPSVSDGYGAETILAAYQQSEADLLISCIDVWVIPPQVTSHTKFAPWFPVDHDPLPEQIANALAPSIYPMTYSKWGVEICKDAGIDAKYVPGSADASVFCPMDREEARKAIGIPPGLDIDFLATMVAANKDITDRKGFSEALQGFAEFLKTHPKAYLYIHTNWKGAIDIQNLAKRLGIGEHTIMPDQYALLTGLYPEAYMKAVYNASDVLLNPAKSEGFGLPVLEAQMCGCPVAVTDFSTGRELLFAGWLIDGQKHWTCGADSWRLLANVDSVRDALSAAYDDKGNELVRHQARQGAMALDIERVTAEYWAPALKDMEEIVCGATGQLKLVTF